MHSLRKVWGAAAWAATAAAIIVLAASAAQAQIQRWTDEHGKVHYGDSPPPAASQNVRTLPKATPLSQDDEARARAALERDRDALKPAAPAAPSPRPMIQARRPASAPVDNSCHAQWTHFTAATACLDPCRGRNGGLRGDCAAPCPELRQPDCRMPEEIKRDLQRRY